MVTLSATMANAQYCGGGPSSTGDTDLQSASLVGETSSISFTNVCPGVTGIENQLAQVADLKAGSTYTLNLSWGTCGGLYSNGGNAWIDFDGSASFDADEIVATKAYGSSPLVASYTFTVPIDATVGSTRMRIMQRESASPPLNPCASFSWGSAADFTININPACTDVDIDVSATELCEGEAFTLDATAIGAISWTGGITDGVPFIPGAPGTYTYTLTTDSEEDCDADPVVIEVIGLPTVIAGAGDLIFCEDESITLSTGGDADLYVWEDGDPLNLTPGIGTYTYSLTGYYTEGGCLGENTDEVTVEVVGLPTITASVSQSPICINNEVTFNGGGGTEYDWDNGVVDGDNFTPGSTGIMTYTVYGTDENGCSNSASVDLEVVDLVSLSGVVTEEIAGDDGAIDITVTGGAPAYSFDWNNDETGDFDDTEDLTGLAPGFYTVVVQSDAGCGSSHTFQVGTQVGVDEIGNSLISVYPNPTQDNLNIELVGAFSFEIVSVSGEIILSGSANDKKIVSLREFADGVYFVNVKSADASTTLKVIKK